jgi:hypothetical protein
MKQACGRFNLYGEKALLYRGVVLFVCSESVVSEYF